MKVENEKVQTWKSRGFQKKQQVFTLAGVTNFLKEKKRK